MALPVKPVAILSCLSGAACTISIPISLHSQQKAQINSTGGDQQINSNSSRLGHVSGAQPTHENQNSEIGEELEDNEEEDFLTFETLLNNLEEIKSPLEEKLPQILKSDSTDTKWTIIAKDLEKCQISYDSQRSFCGYLELKNNKQDRYKLRVSKFEEEKGVVTIVKPKGSTIEYGDENTHLGKEKLEVNFENLSTFKNPEQGSGEGITETSFTA